MCCKTFKYAKFCAAMHLICINKVKFYFRTLFKILFIDCDYHNPDAAPKIGLDGVKNESLERQNLSPDVNPDVSFKAD